MTTPALTDVYRGLKEVGLTRSQVAKLLPDWWAPDVARSEAGLWETAVLLGRRLSIEAGALLQGRIQQTVDISPARFKHTVRVTPAQLGPAALVANSLAKAVLAAMPNKGQLAHRPALSIRQELLENPDSRIDFDSLLQFCWAQGIPVIPLPHLPRGIRKMDAAAIRVGGQAAIVIALRNNSKAWLSFLLAHELGHISLNHVTENAALIEGSISDSTDFDAESQMDAQEVEANAFALDLLGGIEADDLIANWSGTIPAVTLASMATAQAQSTSTAPGHLILRYAFKTHRWPDARTALNFLADDLDAQTSLIDRMQQEINTSELAEDLRDYVEKITGVTPQH